MFQDLTSLVIDIGTQKSRIGYGGDDAPRMMPFSYVSTHSDKMKGQGQSSILVGDKYLSSDRSDNNIMSIFQQKNANGYQYQFDLLQTFIQHHLTKELGVDLKDYSILFSQDVAARVAQNKEARQKIAAILFQKLGVANVFYLKAPVLSCFATGRSSALVVDSGHNFTRSIAVHQGFCLQRSTRVANYGGSNLNKLLQKLLIQKLGREVKSKYLLSNNKYKKQFLDFHQTQLYGDIKQSLSVRKQEELGTDTPVTSVDYQLPDKQVVSIHRKQIKDSFITGDQSQAYKGVINLIGQTASSCDVDVKKQLYSNLLLNGGNILYGSNIEDILSKVNDISPANVKVKSVSVCTSPQRKHLAWIGGSIVTSLSSFQSYWIGNQEWKQCGPTIIQKKCT